MKNSLTKASKVAALPLLIGMSMISSNTFSEDWAGPYVGGSLGYVQLKNEGKGDSLNDTSPFALDVWDKTNESSNINGFSLGVKGGFDWQQDRLVYGVIADLLYTDVSDEGGELDYGNYSYHREDSMDFMATLRGRVGQDFNGFLTYLTGGVALAKIENIHQTITCCPTLYESNNDDLKIGYVLGVGVEKHFQDNFYLTLEGLYSGFSDEKGDTGGPNSIDGQPSDVKLKNSIMSVNLGLKYKLK